VSVGRADRRSLKDLRDKAEALEKYAKAAKHFESELRAMDIRLRASVRAGALIAEGQKNGSNSAESPHLIETLPRRAALLSVVGFATTAATRTTRLFHRRLSRFLALP
jgi:hypothetical protein